MGHCCAWGHCSGAGLILGPGILHAIGRAKKKKKTLYWLPKLGILEVFVPEPELEL